MYEQQRDQILGTQFNVDSLAGVQEQAHLPEHFYFYVCRRNFKPAFDLPGLVGRWMNLQSHSLQQVDQNGPTYHTETV